MVSTFPNFRLDNVEGAVGTWQLLLDEYNANDVFLAFTSYCKTSGSGFAPSVAQLIEEMEKPKQHATMSESEAWALVRKAISRSAYNSQEEFDKLPLNVKRAVGSAEVLHYWAIDSEFNNEVVMSQFYKSYRTATKREEEFSRLPAEMKLKAIQLCEKSNNSVLVLDMKEVNE